MKLWIIIATVLFAGCSTSGTSILIGEGGPYEPTSPETVTLLLAPPEKPHMIIALVEGVAATDDYFTKVKTEAASINAMKEEAARIGANAIILTGKGTKPYGQMAISNTSVSAYGGYNSVSAFGATTSSGIGWEKITFSGTAIRYTESK